MRPSLSCACDGTGVLPKGGGSRLSVFRADATGGATLLIVASVAVVSAAVAQTVDFEIALEQLKRRPSAMVRITPQPPVCSVA